MKKHDIAQMIGITSRQQIDFVLSGKRNFSYPTAKKATLVIGGTVALWIEKNREKERRDVWERFVERTKTIGETEK